MADYAFGSNPPYGLKSLDPAQVVAAFSKLFAANTGDMVVVLSRSSAYKHHSLADIEWMVMPPVSAGQFFVVEAMGEKHGYRAPRAKCSAACLALLERKLAGIENSVLIDPRLGALRWIAA